MMVLYQHTLVQTLVLKSWIGRFKHVAAHVGIDGGVVSMANRYAEAPLYPFD